MRQARRVSSNADLRPGAATDARQQHRGEHSQEQLRRGREYLRQWRANPKNRARLRAATERQVARRKQAPSRDGDAKVCAFCRRRRAVKQIERLITTRDGFQPVLLPSCADC